MAEAAAADHDMAVAVKPHKKPSILDEKEYKVFACGNSALDLFVLIPGALIMVYGMTAALFALCLRAVLQSDETDAALWMFFGMWVFFVVLLGIVLSVNTYDEKVKKALAEEDQV